MKIRGAKVVIFKLLFNCYYLPRFFQDSNLEQKEPLRKCLEGKTQLSGVTKITCKECHFLWIYRNAVLQSTCCCSVRYPWKACVNQRKF